MDKQKIPEGYKHTEVGVIPEDWDVTALGELAELTSSKRIFESDYVNDGIPFYRGQEISSLLERKEITDVIYISNRKYNELKSRYGAPKIGEILITAVGTLGNALLINSTQPFYFKDGNLIWVRKIKNCAPEFLIKQLNYNKPRVLGCAIGSSQKALTMVSLTPLEIALPVTLKEQTAIANALSDVDALIAGLEKLIAKKQAIKTATMQQLLTGRTRLPEFANHPDGTPKGYKQTELGEIPEDWEVLGLGFLVEGTINRKPINQNSIVSFVGMQDVSEDAQLIGQQMLDCDSLKSGFTYFERGDVLLAKITPCFENGKGCHTVSLQTEIGFGSTEFHVLRAKKDADSMFIYYWSTKNNFRKELESEMVGSAGHRRVPLAAVYDYKIPVPPKNQQTAIANILSAMDEEIQSLQRRLDKTRKIKQGMMQELLTGKTRLV